MKPSVITYKVRVSYPVHYTADFFLDAATPEEARREALELARAGDGDFHYDVDLMCKPDYEVLDVEACDDTNQKKA